MHETAPLSVLIIDDEESFASTLAMRLELRGMEVRTAFSGQEGLAILESWAPRLLLLDMRMPEMSGIDVLRIVRARTPALPVLVITGHCSEQDYDAALALGVQGYHAKPLDFEEVMRSIRGIASSGAAPVD